MGRPIIFRDGNPVCRYILLYSGAATEDGNIREREIEGEIERANGRGARATTMAAALVKVIRGRRSGASSQLLLPAMKRLISQESVLPHLGSSPAASAPGMGRLMHTGQWRNSGPLVGIGSKLAEQKALLFGTRRVLIRNQKPQGWRCSAARGS